MDRVDLVVLSSNAGIAGIQRIEIREVAFNGDTYPIGPPVVDPDITLPWRDLKGTSREDATTFPTHVGDFADETQNYIMDRIKIDPFCCLHDPNAPPTAPTDVGGVLWARGPVSPGSWELTTMYARDLNPGSDDDDLDFTGFDPFSPQLGFSDETFFGLTENYSGTPLGTLRIGDLASVFPDFDLSPFSAAMVDDPDSVVYVFQAIVPAEQFPLIPLLFVPEPTSLVLFGVGLIVLIGCKRLRQNQYQ